MPETPSSPCVVPAELTELQALMKRAITHPLGVDAFLAEADAGTRAAFEAAFDETPALDRRARVGIYADAYFWRLHGVLQDHCSLLAWLLGRDRFRNLATDYVLQCPSTDPDIRRLGAPMAGFVRAHPEETRMPGLHELVAIEWAMVRALDIPQAPARTVADLLALPAEQWPQMRLSARASVWVGRCHHDFDALWTAHEREPSPALPPVAGPTRHVVVWRHALAVMHRMIEANEAAAIAAMIGGVDFATLCDGIDAPTATAWLGRWIADGLVAGDGSRAAAPP